MAHFWAVSIKLTMPIGGLVAMIPWGVMAYLGMSVTGEAGSYFSKLAEVRKEEARINALQNIEIKTIGSQQYLMLPANITKIYMCGSADGTPCIRLEE